MISYSLPSGERVGTIDSIFTGTPAASASNCAWQLLSMVMNHQAASPRLNIVFGSISSVIIILVIRGGWHYYVLYGLIEIPLTVRIVWYAWTWPKQPTR